MSSARFQTSYAAVSAADGSHVKLYFQKPTGALCEGVWQKRTGQWAFSDILEAGSAMLNTPLTAMYPPSGTVHLMYADSNRYIQELQINNGRATATGFGRNKAKLDEGGHIAGILQKYGDESLRLYQPGSSGTIKSYAHKSGEWNTPGGLSCTANPQTPIAGISCFPWHWPNPCLWVFYCNPSCELKSMSWDGAWREGSLPISVGPNVRFAAASTHARGDNKANMMATPVMMVFAVEDGQLQMTERDYNAHWGPPEIISIEREGTNIAAVSAPDGDGENDVHVFTSDEDGKFIHRIRKHGRWTDEVVDPHPVIIIGMRGGGVIARGGSSNSGSDTETTEAPSSEMGNISFMESLRAVGLTLGSEEEHGERRSRFQIPDDEDHEHITVPKIEEATYQETAQRLSYMYHAAIDQSGALHKAALIDSNLPAIFPLPDMRKTYGWSDPRSDNYPPHLDQGLFKNATDLGNFNGIFRKDYLLPIAELFSLSLPWSITEGALGVPWKSNQFGIQQAENTLAGIQEATKQLHDKKKGMYTKNTIGDNPKWFTDEQFAQQHLSGTNPTTIKVSPTTWTGSFIKAAKAQGVSNFEKVAMAATQKGSLFVQDYSYFRPSMRKGATYELSYKFGQDQLDAGALHGRFFHERYGCASVVLFELHDDGHLHPLAIVLDYKEDDIKLGKHGEYEKTSISAMSNSVVIFNKKMSPTDRHDEEHDWPWRYAKMCAQVSDWHRHEICIHLVNTHMIEEGAIVAMMRTVEEKHVVFRLLKPHWVKTLPLNHAARLLLMPKIIKPIAGMRPSDMNTFTQTAYANFDWESKYIPNDLHNRGFPNRTKDLDNKKWRNYPYARNMVQMWDAIHNFVGRVLTDHYENDAAVQRDTQIQDWVNEMHSDKGARQKLFPNIHSLNDLINVVTMCIHIASPQHTAVNYLQEYYQTFVPNKPPSFFKPIPKSQSELAKVNEQFIVSSLPFTAPTLGRPGTGNVWLLAAHLPHLLSDEVHAPLDMESYADQAIQIEQMSGSRASVIAAREFKKSIQTLKTSFEKHSSEMSVKPTPTGYDVMDPKKMAVSILI
ncbi:hypothetical protein TWF694_004287 [Orbilia ellipsospora]|uniref:Manganese lipoxygenase n=1 Tax=Orbilia ellipsospora TaxID=2528407 RepID=A0AAV9WXN1_9PEZI